MSTRSSQPIQRGNKRFFSILIENIESYGRILILPIIIISANTGCVDIGPKCMVSISNVSEIHLNSVTVTLPQNNKLTFSNISPNSSAKSMRSEQGMNQLTKIRIVPADGSEKNATVDLKRAVPATFRGKVVFQIEPENQIRTFVMPETPDDNQGTLPWDIPPTWTAAPSIPGMDGD